jgi:adenosine deaminase
MTAAALSAQPVTIEQKFTQVRKNPPELYAFLLAMPKGADLHVHMTGSVYAETYMRFAAEDNLCVDLKTYALIARPGATCGENAKDATLLRTDNNLAGAVIDSLSMRNFVPGRESAHDHFFATFGKFGPGRGERYGEMVAEIAERAASQNESYVELMAINANAANASGTATGFDGNLDATKAKLLSGGLPQAVAAMRGQIDQLEAGRKSVLQCDSHPDSPACRVGIGYVMQVLRESPKEVVFAQILASFMLGAEDPRVVAVNMVQPEDGLVSMRDYYLQMQMMSYAKRLNPKVHVTLHAGELASGLVPPDGLRFHIREAVELAGAERIGHGVDVAYENDSAALLAEMKRRRVLVEINLTSNDLILGVRGKDHPLPLYRQRGVPVALSTDDEGVSRSHLTQEYQRAVLDYGLSYADLKEMVRNSLEYSFIPGESYWRAHNYSAPVSICLQGRKTTNCQMFLKANPKAQSEADLEDRFVSFEKSLTASSAARSAAP